MLNLNALQILVALCIAESVHNMFEIWGMRQKVQWLNSTMQGRQHGQWPLNINTKTKTIVLHGLIAILFSGLAFYLLTLLNLTTTKLIWLGVAILVLNYAYTTWKVDQFHTEIGRLIARTKEKSIRQWR